MYDKSDNFSIIENSLLYYQNYKFNCIIIDRNLNRRFYLMFSKSYDSCYDIHDG